jgi:hypothetical protein
LALGKVYPLKNAPLKLKYYALKAINQKLHVGGIFCELPKAFD